MSKTLQIGINTSRPFFINIVSFGILFFAASLFSKQAEFFALLTVGIILFLAFEPFKLVLIYTVLIFYRDIFVGEVFGISTDMLEYLTLCSNYVFVILLISIVIYRVKLQLRSPISWPIAFFFGVMIFCSLFSSDLTKSLQVLFRLFQLTSYFFILYTLLNSERRIKYFLFILLGVFFIVVIVSGYNFIFNQDRLAHLRHFMVFPALASGLFIYLMKYSFNRLIGWWLMLISIAGSISLLITESRRVLMALIISWTVFLIISRYRVSSLIFLSVFILGSLAYSPKKILSRFQKTTTSLEVIRTGDILDETEAFNLYTGRDKLWKLGWEEFYKNPVFGLGLGTSRSIAIQNFGKPLRLHNIYLELLVETGVIGLAAFIILLGAFLLLCRKMIIQHKRYKNFYFYLAFTLFSIILIFFSTNYFGGASVFEKYEWVFYAILAASFRTGIRWEREQLNSV